MEKFSVKKPFTVLVAVVMVLILGFVSVTSMSADLLPEITLPYMMVITTYPGASPERVESTVTQPMESGLGTISGVANVYSVSAENYSMVQLEFEEDTDMDSAMVKVSSAVQKVRDTLPDGCGTPTIMELSMDMMATMYVSVSRDGYDIYRLSDYVNDTVLPYIERQNGVASVSTVGLVEQSVVVELDQAKIDDVNARLLEQVNTQLADAKKELDRAEAKVRDGKKQLDAAQGSFGSMLSGALFGQIESSVNGAAADLKTQVDALLAQVEALRAEITDGETGAALDSITASLREISRRLEGDMTAENLAAIAAELQNVVAELNTILDRLGDAQPQPGEGEPPAEGETSTDALRQTVEQVRGALAGLSNALGSVPAALSGLESAYAGMTQAQLEAAVGFATAQTQLAQAQAQLDAARTQYEAAKESALASANLDSLLTVSTLSQLIYAQNFAMPAGYIDDAADNTWLLKVGDEFESAADIAGALLCSIDGVGDVRLEDVANVTVVDNSGESYARLNGEAAVILAIFKGSTAGTNEVGDACLRAFEELAEKYEGTHAVTLMNQGDYIDLILKSVLTSMVSGAALAIVVLALFLKDVKPTLVVAVSIPLSVLFAIVLMYFTDISLNMMSLSGLALGIGMLVDNSIVVIENIYRLRGRGVSAARAAVQGTKQVAAAITSSTLTTVCVFLPLVFTTGMVRQLLVPMGLCIGYCLMASLVVAMTVVPAAASTLLKNTTPKAHPWFETVQEMYGRALNWCLDHKAAPLLVTVALLAVCVWRVLTMGIVMIPEMTANSIQITVTTAEGMTREESYAAADRALDAILTVDGVTDVGLMDGAAMSSTMTGMSMGGGGYGSYSGYITMPTDTSSALIQRITSDLNALNDAADGYTISASAGGMSEMTALLGSGLSINIYGNDIDTLLQVSEDVMELVESVDGFTGASNGIEDGDPTVHLVIDRDAAMAKGLTVAQIYMQIATRLTTSATATSVTVAGTQMDVVIQNNTDPLTMENLMDISFETTVMGDAGAQTTETHTLGEFASIEYGVSVPAVNRENQTRYLTVSASTEAGQNVTLLSRELQQKLDDYAASGRLPDGYTAEIGGESSSVMEMVWQMCKMLALGCAFVYLVMVAQFQSLLSPFIVLLTVPLAFTGGMLGLMVSGQQLSLLSLMGFVVLMGTVVNNGIVFVDYTNQLRMGGMDRRAALIATGKTRMRPILMTAMTTILAMVQLIFGDDMGSQLGGGMAIVIVGGLSYATLMTLFIIPVLYDIMFKRPPLSVDVGSDDLDDVPDDAAEFIAAALAQQQAETAAPPVGTAESDPGPAKGFDLPLNEEKEDGHAQQ